MKRAFYTMPLFILLLAAITACGKRQPAPTPQASPASTATVAATVSPTASPPAIQPTATSTRVPATATPPKPTSTSAATPVASPQATATSSPAPGATPAQTPSPSPTPTPRLEVIPATAAPGETTTLRGSGWPPGSSLVARMYEEYGAQGADMGGSVQADAQGNFAMQGIVPRTLFGAGNRGNLNVVPGQYIIVARLPGGIGASADFAVGPPRNGGLLWGEVYFDSNGNGQRDAEDTPATALLSIRGPTGAPPLQAFTDLRGRYVLSPVPPSTYTVSTQSQFHDATWSGSATAAVQDGQMARADLLLRP